MIILLFGNSQVLNQLNILEIPTNFHFSAIQRIQRYHINSFQVKSHFRKF